MPRKTKSKKVMSAQDVLKTEIIVNQALIDVLLAKRLITEEELVKSIQNIKRESAKIVSINSTKSPEFTKI